MSVLRLIGLPLSQFLHRQSPPPHTYISTPTVSIILHSVTITIALTTTLTIILALTIVLQKILFDIKRQGSVGSVLRDVDGQCLIFKRIEIIQTLIQVSSRNDKGSLKI